MKFFKLIFILLISFIFSQKNFQSEQIELLKDKHGNLISIFSSVEEWNYSSHNKFLDNEKIKKEFFDALDIYNLTLSIALSNPDFMLNTSLELINKYKYDSKYFSELKLFLKKRSNISIINTYTYQEQESYAVNSDSTPFQKFSEKHVIYIKYGQINKFGSSSLSDRYDFGNSFDLMFYSPKKLKVFNLDLMLGYSISHSSIPASGNGIDLEIQKINLHVVKYLNKIPLYIDIGVGPMMNNKNIGGNFEFILSYFIPIKAVDLALNISYEQFIDITDDFKLIFGTQDFIGINLTVGKSFILK